MVQGKITEADTPTIQLSATPSGLISDPPPSSLHLYAACPSCCNPPTLSWLGTCTRYAGLHTQWCGSIQFNTKWKKNKFGGRKVVGQAIMVAHWAQKKKKWMGECLPCPIGSTANVIYSCFIATSSVINYGLCVCGIKVTDGFTCNEIKERLGRDHKIRVIEQNRLRWYGRISRKNETEKNAGIRKWRVQVVEVDQSKPGVRLWKKTVRPDN